MCRRVWRLLRCRAPPRRQPHDLSIRWFPVLRSGFRWRPFRGLLHGTASSACSMALSERRSEYLRQEFADWTSGSGYCATHLRAMLLPCGRNGFRPRHAEHAFEEVLRHTASPDAQAPGLTRCTKIEGSCAPRTRGADARRARGYLPAMRLPARCRPRRNCATFNMMPLSWFTLVHLSNCRGCIGCNVRFLHANVNVMKLTSEAPPVLSRCVRKADAFLNIFLPQTGLGSPLLHAGESQRAGRRRSNRPGNSQAPRTACQCNTLKSGASCSRPRCKSPPITPAATNLSGQ